MIKIGTIYKIDSVRDIHHGHFFLVAGENPFWSDIYMALDGTCSCGEPTIWFDYELKKTPQTEELKQLFAQLILTQ